ncbi:MAG TPA: 3-keto-5-aminohexanoate cleavage protein [Candidatus Deferrimicrobium sp.]|nr:3-keto-5-aminohexanoate cleavage protein [Candidatus Deferrimicrobium sp.]
MRKLIITCAPTGSLTTREQLPWIPVTPREIADSALEAYRAGAAIVHIHVRDPKTGAAVQDRESYKETIEYIRAESDMIICTTTGGGATLGVGPMGRIVSLDLKPELASLNCGSMNFGKAIFQNPPDLMETFAQKMKEFGVKPELEAYEIGHIANVGQFLDLLDKPLKFNFVMGVQGGIPATIENLLMMRDTAYKLYGAETQWQVTAIGRYQTPLGIHAILLDGDLRVGFEDNIFYSKGIKAKSNAQLVERMVRIANEIDREIATAEEAREILHLK